ncbi:integrase [Paenibacillus rhizosphaerae]|uniref:Integrase n=1 Tax=Paenibacillus rhizosphaerae TaxID=297318 RepID=A0A1R1E6F5_9BACL|nr:site-specific integrase [Paenibacillus rhizosphaerae]OMF47312.1 integrase [Paenibacillus rhizosphaerae]
MKEDQLSVSDKFPAELISIAENYIEQARAENTVMANKSDWSMFEKWCDESNLVPLPATDQCIAIYLAYLASSGNKASTIRRKLSSIKGAHLAAGFSDPTGVNVKHVWAGIRRQHGTKENGKKPVEIELLKQMLREIPDNLGGVRDKAILLIGFAGALRRSEIVALDVGDITLDPNGLIVQIHHSKTDPESKGELVGIPYGKNKDTCPVQAYLQWLKVLNGREGALFRPIDRHGNIKPSRLSDKAVSLIVKKYIEAIGLESNEYSGHSLRAGFATTAASLGKSERLIMKQTRHLSEKMVRRYIRMNSIFRDNTAGEIGL